MSTINERLLDRVRMDLGDLESPFDYQFIGDGHRDHFYVEHRPIKQSSLVIINDGAVVADPDARGIAVDHDSGMVVFATAPDSGSLWEIQGQKWRYFSDSDLQIYIDTALAQHSHNRGDSSGSEFTKEDIKPVEEYPIALLSAIQALWALATDASFDIDILAPDGVNIPRSERYRQLLEIIGARQHQYDEMAAALNIGLNAIEVFTARRTAKLTNRLVPVYLPKEFDDNTRPKRVLFPPMLQGTEPVKTGIGNYDWNIITGDPCGATFDFAFDLTDCVIENAIRAGLMTSQSGSWGPPTLKFNQEIIDASNGLVRLYLSGEETRKIPYNCYWEVQVQKPGEEFRTKMRGLVKASNSEVVR